MLLSHGHQESAVMDYSVEKFNLYVRSAQRREAGGRLVDAVDMSICIGSVLGGGKALKDHLTELEDCRDNG